MLTAIATYQRTAVDNKLSTVYSSTNAVAIPLCLPVTVNVDQGNKATFPLQIDSGDQNCYKEQSFYCPLPL